MQRVHGVQDDTRGPRAGQGGGNLLSHVPRLADADDHDLSVPAQCLDDQRNRLVERPIELSARRFKGGDLDVKHSAGLGQVTHTLRMSGMAGRFNQELGSSSSPARGQLVLASCPCARRL